MGPPVGADNQFGETGRIFAGEQHGYSAEYRQDEYKADPYSAALEHASSKIFLC